MGPCMFSQVTDFWHFHNKNRHFLKLFIFLIRQKNYSWLCGVSIPPCQHQHCAWITDLKKYTLIKSVVSVPRSLKMQQFIPTTWWRHFSETWRLACQWPMKNRHTPNKEMTWKSRRCSLQRTRIPGCWRSCTSYEDTHLVSVGFYHHFTSNM